MLVNRSFRPTGGTIHLMHETFTALEGGTRACISLCGATFFDVREVWSYKPAVCTKCLKRDHPFGLPERSTVKLLAPIRDPNGCQDLIARDLVHPQTFALTPRGEVLAQDLKEPTPWSDEAGIIHVRQKRRPRRHAICGAVLQGFESMTLVGLDKLRAANAASAIKVSCLQCLLEP